MEVAISFGIFGVGQILISFASYDRFFTGMNLKRLCFNGSFHGNSRHCGGETYCFPHILKRQVEILAVKSTTKDKKVHF